MNDTRPAHVTTRRRVKPVSRPLEDKTNTMVMDDDDRTMVKGVLLQKANHQDLDKPKLQLVGKPKPIHITETESTSESTVVIKSALNTIMPPSNNIIATTDDDPTLVNMKPRTATANPISSKNITNRKRKHSQLLGIQGMAQRVPFGAMHPTQEDENAEPQQQQQDVPIITVSEGSNHAIVHKGNKRQKVSIAVANASQNNHHQFQVFQDNDEELVNSFRKRKKSSDSHKHAMELPEPSPRKDRPLSLSSTVLPPPTSSSLQVSTTTLVPAQPQQHMMILQPALPQQQQMQPQIINMQPPAPVVHQIPQQQQMAPMHAAQTPATTAPRHSRPAPSPAPTADQTVYVNKKPYVVLDCIGKGGSSKVYRCLNAQKQIVAVKKVSLKDAEASIVEGYKNEIELLSNLKGKSNIIQLLDSEVREKSILIVMECGEVDLNNLIKTQLLPTKYDSSQLLLNQIRIYWQQMLQAVQTIHDERIVHGDLKPANFLHVKGTLKLIDFGIAKAISNDTTNIMRESQVGTLNYISPEALKDQGDNSANSKFKMGRPSDIWSLGCILYQMIYNKAPFAHITNVIQKLNAISNPDYEIQYAKSELATQEVVDVLKNILDRNPANRYTIPQLLQHPFLTHVSSKPLVSPYIKSPFIGHNSTSSSFVSPSNTITISEEDLTKTLAKMFSGIPTDKLDAQSIAKSVVAAMHDKKL